MPQPARTAGDGSGRPCHRAGQPGDPAAPPRTSLPDPRPGRTHQHKGAARVALCQAHRQRGVRAPNVVAAAAALGRAARHLPGSARQRRASFSPAASVAPAIPAGPRCLLPGQRRISSPPALPPALQLHPHPARAPAPPAPATARRSSPAPTARRARSAGGAPRPPRTGPRPCTGRQRSAGAEAPAGRGGRWPAAARLASRHPRRSRAAREPRLARPQPSAPSPEVAAHEDAVQRPGQRGAQDGCRLRAGARGGRRCIAGLETR